MASQKINKTYEGIENQMQVRRVDQAWHKHKCCY